MGPITLLRYFTFAGDNGTAMFTDWVQFPAEHQNAQLVVQAHSRLAGSSSAVSVQAQTTWDTALPHNIGSAIVAAGQAVQTGDITTAIGPMVRLLLTGAADDSVIVISVWITPKSE